MGRPRLRDFCAQSLLHEDRQRRRRTLNAKPGAEAARLEEFRPRRRGGLHDHVGLGVEVMRIDQIVRCKC